MSKRGDRVDLRVYRPQGQSFHPKAYLLADRQGRSAGFVGSSNLSGSALQGELEWNYRLIPEEDARGLQELRRAFEVLFARGEALTASWVQEYRSRRTPPLMGDGASVVAELASPERLPVPEPHPVQREAMLALEATGRDGNQAALVVLATGLGKPYLAAFDSLPFQRVLFVAHRDEILTQARDTFRKVRPRATLGLTRTRSTTWWWTSFITPPRRPTSASSSTSSRAFCWPSPPRPTAATAPTCWRSAGRTWPTAVTCWPASPASCCARSGNTACPTWSTTATPPGATAASTPARSRRPWLSRRAPTMRWPNSVATAARARWPFAAASVTLTS